jgi:hypothetical protein
MVVFTAGEVAGMDRAAEAEFSEFMYSRWLQLVRMGYVLTGDRGLAEDLAQTALARAYSSWPQIRRAGDPDAYVRRVMVNANRSRFRKRRVAEHLTGAVPEPASVDATGGCDDRVTLMAALMSLPVGQRSGGSTAVLAGHERDSGGGDAGLLGGQCQAMSRARFPGRWPSCGPVRPWTKELRREQL